MTSAVKILLATYFCMIMLFSGIAIAQGSKSQLPHSEFDNELIHKDQYEITNENSYKWLHLLVPNAHLFLVSEPIPELSPPPPFDFRSIPANLFAILPSDKKVMKLFGVNDFSKLQLKIRTSKDALILVQMFSDFQTGSRMVVRFSGMPFMAIPENIGCVAVSQEPLRKAGIKKPSVRILHEANKESSFEITRYMLPTFAPLGFGDSYSFDSVNKIIEHVGEDGSYEMTSEIVSTPGLSVRNRCGAR